MKDEETGRPDCGRAGGVDGGESEARGLGGGVAGVVGSDARRASTGAWPVTGAVLEKMTLSTRQTCQLPAFSAQKTRCVPVSTPYSALVAAVCESGGPNCFLNARALFSSTTFKTAGAPASDHASSFPSLLNR